MDDSVETSAKTVAEAVELALLRLGARRNEVEIEVLSEGRSGILGIGAEDARVRVTRVAGAPPARRGRRPAAAEPSELPVGEAEAGEAPEEAPRRRRAPSAARSRKGEAESEPEGAGAPEMEPAPAAALAGALPEEEEGFDFEEEEDEEGVAAPPQAGGDREVAVAGREVLEEILEHMGIYADVRILEGDNEAIILDITGADLGVLIGRRGATLASLQFIVNLILGKRFQYRSKVMVDVEGYRMRREQSLTSLAQRMAERVRSTGQTVTLEAMAPAERRIVHLALQSDPDVMTQSVGEGEARKVTILRRR
jgi:spoIIIJ-associated protein